MPTTTHDPHTPDTANPTVPVPAAGPDMATPAIPAVTHSADKCGRTAAENKLWAALLAHPLSTAEELATAAGIGRSSAIKILSHWAGDPAFTVTAPPEEPTAPAAPPTGSRSPNCAIWIPRQSGSTGRRYLYGRSLTGKVRNVVDSLGVFVDIVLIRKALSTVEL